MNWLTPLLFHVIIMCNMHYPAPPRDRPTFHVPVLTCLTLAAAFFIAAGTVAPAAWAAEPPVLLRASPPSKAVVRLPDGDLCNLFIVRGKHCASVHSSDEGLNWSEPRVEFPFEDYAGIPVALLDDTGELHAFILSRRGDGRRPTVDYFYDIWHARTVDDRKRWTAPQRIFVGYVGSLNGVAQLASGRIVLPHQFWVPGSTSTPPTGSHVVTTSYSDDRGATWTLSPARLTAPCDADYIGSNYGACEPAIAQLADGRVWMLIRTQTGFLYESFSDDGVAWSPARPSPFRSSNSPADLRRLPDGRLAIFWNNCQDPSRVDGAPIYTTRDVLHVALTDNEGQTWQGYREAFRDPQRNDPPPKRGDRGTAYPFSTVTRQGKLLLGTGQGHGRTALVRIDPDWITATHHEDDFSQGGLDSWCVYKPFGPVERVWRNRTTGARLVDHPTRPGAQVLSVRRPDELAGDEAVWNYPAGSRGKLTLRVLLKNNFGGATIALADRFIPPNDPAAERLELFQLSIQPNGQLGGGGELAADRWSTLTLSWDLAEDQCDVELDGHQVGRLERVNANSGAPSYLRIRSTASQTDPAGLWIERVAVDVSNSPHGFRATTD